MKKYRLLDLFCGVGGAGEGYQRVGFEVTGVDHIPQPNNPHHFIEEDAIFYLITEGHKYDVVHLSPPCQQYSISTAPQRNKGKTYPDYIKRCRELLLNIGIPYVMENVMPAPIRRDLVLRGDMFGLKCLKQRKFEIEGFFIMQPGIPKKKGTLKGGDFTQVVGKGQLAVTGGQPFKHHQGSILANWRYAMQMPWAKTYKELANAIPPAYTEYIGKQLIEQLERKGVQKQHC